jgi:CHASE2 domain-containing sensor protein
VLLLLLYVAIGVRWNDLLKLNIGVVNWLLLAIWILMNALLCWDVRPSQDLALAVVALAGGWVFESWGTHTQLWSYFTGDKPPLWILPAWPVAALATARIAWAIESALAQRQMNFTIPYWLLMALFTISPTFAIRGVWVS